MKVRSASIGKFILGLVTGIVILYLVGLFDHKDGFILGPGGTQQPARLGPGGLPPAPSAAKKEYEQSLFSPPVVCPNGEPSGGVPCCPDGRPQQQGKCQ